MRSNLRYYIHTYGCQMNEADSLALGELLEEQGYQPASGPEGADLILLNTCCVRPKPEHKVYSQLGQLGKLKERNPDLIIAVVGCMAQKEGDSLRRRAPMTDLIIGPRRLHRLPELIEQFRATKTSQCDISLNGAEPMLPTAIRSPQLQTFVNIIQGCTNFCSYCIVPFVRGPETSRPAGEITSEVETLASSACREVTLLGQNVLVYGRDRDDGVGFVELLEMLQPIQGLERIRFTTAHPRDVSQRLIDAVAELPKVCEHFHLPIQAGEDRILEAMGRGYTVSDYRNLIDRIRAAVPDVSMTTDIMVGFPGETEQQFEATLKTYADVRFDQAFTFIYSPRPQTKAAQMPGQLPYPVKRDRLQRLAALQNEISTQINRENLGRSFEVLVEGTSEKDDQRLAGRTRNNKMVVFAGDRELTGQLVSVTMTQAHLWGFEGELT